jgi:hypothetical protein
MGWAKEDRGVVRAEGAVPGEEGAADDAGVAGPSGRAPPAPANPEEISLDDDDEGAQGRGQGAADGAPAGEGGEAGPSRGAGGGGAAALGPEPANVVFPSEVPVHFRRGPRRWVAYLCCGITFRTPSIMCGFRADLNMPAAMRVGRTVVDCSTCACIRGGVQPASCCTCTAVSYILSLLVAMLSCCIVSLLAHVCMLAGGGGEGRRVTRVMRSSE